jgi:hypothetical protein
MAQARLTPRKADQRFGPSRERPRFGSCLNVLSRASLISGRISRCVWGRSLTGSAELRPGEGSVQGASGLAPCQTQPGLDSRPLRRFAHVPSPRTGSVDSTIQKMPDKAAVSVSPQFLLAR